MSTSQWNQKGATLSYKSACKEFGLTEDVVIDAMKAGKLQYRESSAHGNPYFRLLRAEVESLAKKLHGHEVAKEQKEKHNLQALNREINSLKRKLASLEKRKSEIVENKKHDKA